mgnify:CR=1 FL=1
MSSIQCPSCGKEIQEVEQTCPSCGHTIVSQSDETEKQGEIDFRPWKYDFLLWKEGGEFDATLKQMSKRMGFIGCLFGVAFGLSMIDLVWGTFRFPSETRAMLSGMGLFALSIWRGARHTGYWTYLFGVALMGMSVFCFLGMKVVLALKLFLIGIALTALGRIMVFAEDAIEPPQ